MIVSETDSLRYFFLKSSGDLMIYIGDDPDSLLFKTEDDTVPTGIFWFDLTLLVLLIFVAIQTGRK